MSAEVKMDGNRKKIEKKERAAIEKERGRLMINRSREKITPLVKQRRKNMRRWRRKRRRQEERNYMKEEKVD